MQAGARTFVLLVDDMSLAPHRPEDVRKALGRFLREGLRDGDELIFATTQRRRVVERAPAGGPGRRSGAPLPHTRPQPGRRRPRWRQRLGGLSHRPLRGGGRPGPDPKRRLSRARRPAHERGAIVHPTPGPSRLRPHGAGHAALLRTPDLQSRSARSDPSVHVHRNGSREGLRSRPAAGQSDTRRPGRRRPGGLRPHRGPRPQVASAPHRGVPERPRPSRDPGSGGSSAGRPTSSCTPSTSAASSRAVSGPWSGRCRTSPRSARCAWSKSRIRRRATWAWPRTRAASPCATRTTSVEGPCGWPRSPGSTTSSVSRRPKGRGRATGGSCGWR